ncbi:hypothetical protein EON81_09780 [bacterium]|nr:MAG: hypothetical protein EON81_09780 [bacterium]
MFKSRPRLVIVAAIATLFIGGCGGQGTRSYRATATAICNDNTVEYDTRCSTMCSNEGGVKEFLIVCENE